MKHAFILTVDIKGARPKPTPAEVLEGIKTSIDDETFMLTFQEAMDMGDNADFHFEVKA